jgi:hypothetical protein
MAATVEEGTARKLVTRKCGRTIDQQRGKQVTAGKDRHHSGFAAEIKTKVRASRACTSKAKGNQTNV